MTAQTHPITVEQYEHSFEGYPGLRDELINGRIVMTPDAKPLHQQIQFNLILLLHSACANPASDGTRYIVNGNSNIKLSPIDMPSPDVFVVSWPAWRRAMRAGEYLDVPPLLAVEILSPGQNVQDKVQVYLEARVDAVWVVYPNERAVIVYAGLEKKPYRGHSEIALPFPLTGSVNLDDIFAGLPELPATTTNP